MTTTDRDLNVIYEKDKNLKREDVSIIQIWLKKQHHLPPLEELQVILFLHSCYYSIEAAKKTIDTYFTRHSNLLHIFQRLDEDDMRRVSSVVLITPLPKETPQGYKILFLKLLDTRAEMFNFAKVIRLLDMVCASHVYRYGPFEGIVVVIDDAGATLAHITKINLLILKHGLDHLQEGAPIRIKQIHFINALPILDKALALGRPFLSKELFGMIQLHSSFETFYKYIPRECLPVDYGGEAPSCQVLQEENVKFLLENSKLLEIFDSLDVDESKRVEMSSIYGIQGTFKKLDID